MREPVMPTVMIILSMPGTILSFAVMPLAAGLRGWGHGEQSR